MKRIYLLLYDRLNRSSRIGSGLILAGSVLFYLFIWGRFHLQVAQERTQPPEVDDAYSYLWQAERIPDCLGPCPALQSIADIILTQPDNHVVQNSRARMNYRLLMLYAPLQALGLNITQNVTGLSPAHTFYVLIATGLLLQAIGLAYLLNILWGRMTAAVALTLVTLSVQQGQGLHYIVPSNITLMIGFIVWARILQHGRSAWRALLLGVMILVVSHTLGRVYALFAIGLFILSGSWRLTRREVLVVGASISIVALYWFFAVTVRWPAIDFQERQIVDPNQSSTSAVIMQQAMYLFEQITTSINNLSRSGPAISVALLGLGVLSLSGVQRERLGRFTLMLAGLILAMVFYILPGYVNEGLRRTYPIANITLWYGLIAWLLVIAASWLLAQLHRRILRGYLFLQPEVQSVRLWVMVAWLFLLASSLAVIFNIWTSGIPAVVEARQQQRLANNFVLKPEVVDVVLNQIQPGEQILYYSRFGRYRPERGEFPAELALEYALTVGSYRYGAVFPPLLNAAQADEIRKTHYLIGVNPIMNGAGEIQLIGQTSLMLTTPEPVSPHDLEVYIVGGEHAFDLNLNINGRSWTVNINVDAAGWVKFADVPDAPVQKMTLTAIDPPGEAKLQGIRLTPSQPLWWPWAQKASLTYQLYDSETTLTFDPAILVPDGEVEVSVLDDSPGYLLAARLNWK